MTRKRIRHEQLSNESRKNQILTKRAAGLFKKAEQLCVLCGVDISIVVHKQNGDRNTLMWPSQEAFQEKLHKYLDFPVLERGKKMVIHEKYMEQAVNTEMENLMKAKKVADAKEAKQLLAGAVLGGGKYTLDEMNMNQLNAVGALADDMLKALYARVEELNNNATDGVGSGDGDGGREKGVAEMDVDEEEEELEVDAGNGGNGDYEGKGKGVMEVPMVGGGDLWDTMGVGKGMMGGGDLWDIMTARSSSGVSRFVQSLMSNDNQWLDAPFSGGDDGGTVGTRRIFGDDDNENDNGGMGSIARFFSDGGGGSSTVNIQGFSSAGVGGGGGDITNIGTFFSGGNGGTASNIEGFTIDSGTINMRGFPGGGTMNIGGVSDSCGVGDVDGNEGGIGIMDTFFNGGGSGTTNIEGFYSGNDIGTSNVDGLSGRGDSCVGGVNVGGIAANMGMFFNGGGTTNIGGFCGDSGIANIGGFYNDSSKMAGYFYGSGNMGGFFGNSGIGTVGGVDGSDGGANTNFGRFFNDGSGNATMNIGGFSSSSGTTNIGSGGFSSGGTTSFIGGSGAGRAASIQRFLNDDGNGGFSFGGGGDRGAGISDGTIGFGRFSNRSGDDGGAGNSSIGGNGTGRGGGATNNNIGGFSDDPNYF